MADAVVCAKAAGKIAANDNVSAVCTPKQREIGIVFISKV